MYPVLSHASSCLGEYPLQMRMAVSFGEYKSLNIEAEVRGWKLERSVCIETVYADRHIQPFSHGFGWKGRVRGRAGVHP